MREVNGEGYRNGYHHLIDDQRRQSAANPMTQYLRSAQRSTLTRSLMINSLVVALAGRAAEEVLLQEISILSGGYTDSDLARVGRRARRDGTVEMITFDIPE